MAILTDYLERVYAGILGKIIGVYLGRPFEGWTYQRILGELGPIKYYVNERLGKPLVVTDDDISGTFTFVRALSEHGNIAALTAAQIGQTWLNNIIEKRTILWWGGFGNSTEHTAFLRLKQGVPAPRSGLDRSLTDLRRPAGQQAPDRNMEIALWVDEAAALSGAAAEPRVAPPRRQTTARSQNPR